jgi:hypothetical protein
MEWLWTGEAATRKNMSTPSCGWCRPEWRSCGRPGNLPQGGAPAYVYALAAPETCNPIKRAWLDTGGTDRKMASLRTQRV